MQCVSHFAMNGSSNELNWRTSLMEEPRTLNGMSRLKPAHPPLPVKPKLMRRANVHRGSLLFSALRHSFYARWSRGLRTGLLDV